VHCAERPLIRNTDELPGRFKSRECFTKTGFFGAIDTGFRKAGIGTERDVEPRLRKRKF